MKTIIVAKVIVVNNDDQLLLLRRSESDVKRPLQWDLPGGHTDDDEFAEEAATRETYEEAGIEIDPRSLRLVSTRTTMVEPEKNVSWLFYIAKVDNPMVTVSNEHSEYRWASLAEALEVVDYDVQKELLTYIQDNNLL